MAIIGCGVVDMRKVVYFKDTGLVDRLISIDQEIDVYFYHFPLKYKENLDYIIVENPPRDIENYKVIDGELVRLSKQEIKELRLYGRVLTEEERQLETLTPSPEEVKKAEQTIEILTLIQEVI